jgi:hypothetical protein
MDKDLEKRVVWSRHFLLWVQCVFTPGIRLIKRVVQRYRLKTVPGTNLVGTIHMSSERPNPVDYLRELGPNLVTWTTNSTGSRKFHLCQKNAMGSGKRVKIDLGPGPRWGCHQGMISTLICWFDYQNQAFQACFLKYHWFVIIKVGKQSDY